MKKILSLVMFACLGMSAGAMNTPSKAADLNACIKNYVCLGDNNAEARTAFADIITKLEPLTDQERFDGFMTGIKLYTPEVTQHLLKLWQKNVNINYKNPNHEPLLNYVVDAHCNELCLRPNAIDSLTIEHQKKLYRLYTYICTTFKETLNINIKNKYSQTPFMNVCSDYIIFKKEHNKLDIFLEDFLSTFATQVDTETTDAHGSNIFDMCHSTKTTLIYGGAMDDLDPFMAPEKPANKKKLLVILKKYFPNKLCFY